MYHDNQHVGIGWKFCRTYNGNRIWIILKQAVIPIKATFASTVDFLIAEKNYDDLPFRA